MHTNSQFSPAETPTTPKRDGVSLRRLIEALPARISAWATARAHRIGAELIWRELSKLSDAELHERGLTRATLARDVCAEAARRKAR
jgi:hypothetical protein